MCILSLYSSHQILSILAWLFIILVTLRLLVFFFPEDSQTLVPPLLSLVPSTRASLTKPAKHSTSLHLRNPKANHIRTLEVAYMKPFQSCLVWEESLW